MILTFKQVETSLDPISLLGLLKEVEVQVGREKTFRNGPRVLDLDLLFYDDVILDTRSIAGEEQPDEIWLQVPHPRIPEREFVLRPLAE